MKYCEFLNYITSNDIHIFDSMNRIIYFKLYNNHNINILKQIPKLYLYHFLYAIYNNDTTKANYIINNYL
jgi:hypothetical protein